MPTLTATADRLFGPATVLPTVAEMLAEIEAAIDAGPNGPLVYPTVDECEALADEKLTRARRQPRRTRRSRAIDTKPPARRVAAGAKAVLAIEAAVAERVDPQAAVVDAEIVEV